MIEIKQGQTTLYTINDYTYTESEMGDSNITLKLEVPVRMEIVELGQPEVDVLAPVFSKDWYVEEFGEKFYLNTDKPQGTNSISSINYEYDLIFDSERTTLKKRMVKDLASLGSDTFISQGLVFKLLSASLTDFVQLIQKNLTDCFGTAWAIVINPAIIGSVVATVTIDVSNTYIWDLLLKTYEYYGVRWKIKSIDGVMTIMVGYDPVELSHIFEYGSENGLTKITREITDTKTINRLRGTGGTRNLPTNYFTKKYSNFEADPNAIAGSFVFKNLMPKCFRDSVKLFNVDGVTPLVDYVTLPDIPDSGIIEDGLDANEDIYPSIEGVTVEGLGRIDEIIDVEQSLFDDPEYKSAIEIAGTVTTASSIKRGVTVNYTDVFTITSVKSIVCKLNLQYLDQYNNIVPPPHTFTTADGTTITPTGTILELSTKLELINVDTGQPVGTATKMSYSTESTSNDLDKTKEISFENLAEGNYKFKMSNVARGTITVNGRIIKFSAVGTLTDIKNVVGVYKPTFDIWVKNIQFNLAAVNTDGTSKYAGTEDGLISFKSGMLAGYDFKILKVSTLSNVFACYPDTTKQLNGVHSAYRLTLIKNDSEYQAGAQMLPNMVVRALPTDKFAILGINLPHEYVTDAESRLQDFLEEQLLIASKEYPTYQIEMLDSFLQENPITTNDIRCGNKCRVRDKRLTTGDISLYINTVTITHNGILPHYAVTVTDKITVNGSTVQRISAQIDAISAGQYAGQKSVEMSIANLDKRYLRKTFEDTAYNEIDFKGGLKASNIKTEDFEQGTFSGSGMGVFKDVSGATVLEVDKLSVRKTATFNEIVINQIKFQGGIVVYSAACMEVSEVDGMTLYFDMKGGTVQNQFALNDIIRCQRWVEGAVTKYYMSVVIEVGVDYITISNIDKDGIIDAAVGDVIVQFGNKDNLNRQAVIEFDVLNGGKQTFYEGLNSFVTTDKNTIDIGQIDGKTMLRVFGDAYIGLRDLTSYIKLNSESGKLQILADVRFLSGDGTFVDIEDGTVLGNKLLVKNEDGEITGGMSGLNSDAIGVWTGGTYQQAKDLVAKAIITKAGSIYGAGGRFKALADGTLELEFRKTLSDGDIIITINSSNGIISTRKEGHDYSVSELSVDGMIVNGGNIQALPSSTGIDFKASIVGLGFGNVEKDLYSGLAALCGVYGDANNSNATPAPSWGGYFKKLHAHGLYGTVKQITTTTILTEYDVFVTCYNTSFIVVSLPVNPQLGQMLWIKLMNAYSVSIVGGGHDLFTNNVVNSYTTSTKGQGISVYFDGQYWIVAII